MKGSCRQQIKVYPLLSADIFIFRPSELYNANILTVNIKSLQYGVKMSLAKMMLLPMQKKDLLQSVQTVNTTGIMEATWICANVKGACDSGSNQGSEQIYGQRLNEL